MFADPAHWAKAALCAAVLSSMNFTATAADAPSPKLALSFQPVQTVEIDRPKAAEVDKCRVVVERKGKSSGWAVYGPQGQLLRRFVDTDGDNVVDQWRYYFQGLEVYRDIDTNANNKVDQSRWLNSHGTRWGIDKDEDGKIESWRLLSAEEAGREAILAMVAGDTSRIEPLLLNDADIKQLGIDEKLSTELLKKVESPSSKMRAVTRRSKLIGKGTKWIRFDSANPGLIPAEDGKANADLMVYENAMGIVEANGKPGLVQIGEMIRVGNVWKLTQIPEPLDSDAAQITDGGLLMRPPMTGGPNATGPIQGDLSPEARKILEQLQELDGKAPAPDAGARAQADYNRKRSALLQNLVDIAKTDRERDQWTKQLVDGLAAAVQTGQYADGLKELKGIEANLKRQRADKDMQAYVGYRALLSEYSSQLQAAGSDTKKRTELQTWWLEQLREFAAAYPRQEETADAMLQLGFTEEYNGRLKEAKEWYGKLVGNHAKTDAGKRAAGAMHRLSLEGKRLSLSGAKLGGGTLTSADYRGKVLLVIFWTTWCKPCTEDLPLIRAMHEQYRSKGFEVIGVNIDTTPDPIDGYLKEHRVPWPHIYEPGGLENSKTAREFGIISVPTMFLVGKDGKVVSRSTSVDELKAEVPKLLLR